MKLRDWLEKEGISAAEFGRRLKPPRSQPTINRYANGERIPERQVMGQIVEATAGQVSPNDFYDLCPPAETGANERANQ